MATIPSNGPADRSVIAIRFGEFEYQTQRGELRKHDLRIRLQPQSLAILLALLDSPGTLITREELRGRVWESGTFVDFEHGLNSAMKRVRDALCDSADEPEYIETVPGRGYRFIAAVEHIRAAASENKSVEESGHAVGAADPANSLAPPGMGRTGTLAWRRTLALGALAVLLCTAATLITARSFGLRSRASARIDSWVLVARFDNRTGESQLDNVLDFALRSDLSNSQVVHVAVPERVQDTLRLMRKPPDTPIDEQTGREICLRDGGIGAVVTGRIEKLSGKYLVAISFVDAQTGTTLRSFGGEADNQQAILPTVNRLSDQLREHLGEAVGEISRSNQQLERATTPSLRALQLFSAGSDLLAEGIPSNEETAAELFSQAIQLDPDFASAYTYLGWAEQDVPGDQGSAIANFRRAVELADKASERERLFILLSWYGLQLNAGDLDKAIHYGELLTSLYPDFYWGVQVQAMLLLHANRPDEAAAMFERGLRLRPNDLDWAVTAWEGFDGDSQQGFRGVRSDLAQMFRKKAEDIAALSGDPALTAFWMPYLDASEKHDRGDDAGAAAALGNARPPDGVLAHHLAVAYLALGKLRDGERVIQGASESEQLQMLVAFLRSGVGGLRSYARLHPASAPVPGGIISLLYARIGDLRGDSPAIRELMPVGQRQAWRSAILGEGAMNRGQYTLAIRELRDALAWPNTSAQQMFLSDSLATALECEGDSGGAAAVLQKSADEFADPLDGPLCPLVLEHLARIYRKEGNTARAATLENHVKKLLEAADPDYSLDAQLGVAPAASAVSAHF